jgi:hypothetical protein
MLPFVLFAAPSIRAISILLTREEPTIEARAGGEAEQQ